MNTRDRFKKTIDIDLIYDDLEPSERQAIIELAKVINHWTALVTYDSVRVAALLYYKKIDIEEARNYAEYNYKLLKLPLVRIDDKFKKELN